MPCGDVPGRVHVSMAGETAGDAGEEGLALAALRCDMPARRATLAGERGINLLHPAGGLVPQATRQQAPARPHDPPVEPGLGADVPAWLSRGSPSRPRHARDVQILDADQVELAGQPG